MTTEKTCVYITVDEYRELVRAQRDLTILKAMLLSYQEETFGLSRTELDSVCKLFCDNQQDESW